MSDERSLSDMDRLVIECIQAIAPTVSTGNIWRARQEPESWAEPRRCFENVWRKIELDGGRAAYGWTFLHRYTEHVPGSGYLLLTHHAVWHAPNKKLIDVSPYPVDRDRPLGPEGTTMFLADEMATPIVRGNITAPRPLRFFAVEPLNEQMMAYVQKLNKEEAEKMGRIYNGDLSPSVAHTRRQDRRTIP